MRDAILVINAGSSSIKFAVFEATTNGNLPHQPLFSGQIENIGAGATLPRLHVKNPRGQTLADRILDDAPADAAGQHRHALDCLLGWLDANDEGIHLRAAGHRVVHGGDKYTHPVQVDDTILETLAQLNSLAPLHQPHNLAAIRVIGSLLPDLPQVACFDTAFHASQPPLARQFALPRAITALGVRRYGFHGLSYEYIAQQMADLLSPEKAQGRVIVAHLGNGASLCAIHQCRSVASTMGFTAVDGLMMGTRTGNLDPGVLLYLMDYQGMDSKALTRLLYKESGLLGVSGLSQDMRTLLAAAPENPAAREAIDLFCYRIQREIGSLAAALGGLDALIFTGGIGEHAAPVRAQVGEGCRWLGIEIDPKTNEAVTGAQRISTPGAKTIACVIPTNEEWMIARHTVGLL